MRSGGRAASNSGELDLHFLRLKQDKDSKSLRSDLNLSHQPLSDNHLHRMISERLLQHQGTGLCDLLQSGEGTGKLERERKLYQKSHDTFTNPVSLHKSSHGESGEDLDQTLPGRLL